MKKMLATVLERCEAECMLLHGRPMTVAESDTAVAEIAKSFPLFKAWSDAAREASIAARRHLGAHGWTARDAAAGGAGTVYTAPHAPGERIVHNPEDDSR